jgi:hypothetical protein
MHGDGDLDQNLLGGGGDKRHTMTGTCQVIFSQGIWIFERLK